MRTGITEIRRKDDLYIRSLSSGWFSFSVFFGQKEGKTALLPQRERICRSTGKDLSDTPRKNGKIAN